MKIEDGDNKKKYIYYMSQFLDTLFLFSIIVEGEK